MENWKAIFEKIISPQLNTTLTGPLKSQCSA